MYVTDQYRSIEHHHINLCTYENVSQASENI